MSSDPIIFDRSDGQELRINMIGSWLKKEFGRKIVKLSIDGGFTCPNRDGTKGTGGCLFCSDSGSGDMASRVDASSIRTALDDQIRLLSDKWPEAGYIAYFQNHTNTYAPADHLRELFYAALEQPDVLGLAIATRSDCISDEVLQLLEELNEKTFLWVELGLQTIHDETAQAMNLCHTRSDYDDSLMRLQSRGIRVVTHLILGLPGETKEMMLDSVRYACRIPHLFTQRPCEPPPLSAQNPCEPPQLFGLKLHMLNVVRNSRLPSLYPDYVPFDSIDEYTDLLIRAIELVPPQITIHRISGDAPRPALLAPDWSWQKRTILNEIHRKMRERNTWQGRCAPTL
ncbi:MAG: TIGR01212 family radical SAM protein [Firmicutes bacterium]|nr:TIGR01212 family radical SAM protein [Bacillota bacterium]